MQRIRTRVAEHWTPEYEVHAMVAIGEHAPADAPDDERPNSRTELDDIVTEGGFPGGEQR